MLESILDALHRQMWVDRITRLPLAILQWGMVTAAIGLLVAAVGFLIAGNVPLGLLMVGCAPFCAGAAFLLTPPTGSVSIRHVSHAGIDEPAFVFSFKRSKALVGGLICAFLALGFAFLAVANLVGAGVGVPGREWWWPLVTVGLGLLAAWLGMVAASGFMTAAGRSYLALLRDGVVLRAGISNAFVPWSAVTDAGIGQTENMGYGSYPCLFIQYADGPGIRTGLLVSLQRRIGSTPWIRWAWTPQLRVMSTTLAARDHEIVDLIRFFRANPKARGRIGTPEGLGLARA